MLDEAIILDDLYDREGGARIYKSAAPTIRGKCGDLKVVEKFRGGGIEANNTSAVRCGEEIPKTQQTER